MMTADDDMSVGAPKPAREQMRGVRVSHALKKGHGRHRGE